MNLTVRGHKAWWAVLGACLSLLSAPAFSFNPAAQVSMIFAFDLHTTGAGVVEGTGSNLGTLYGTTSDTSLTTGGVIYSVSKSGGAPAIIYQLKETDGYSPQATLIVGSDGYLYGTTFYSPRVGLTTTNGSGTVFKIHQDGTGFTTLHTFDPYFIDATTGTAFNTEGAHPNKALVQDSVYLYGVNSAGGANGTGTVFRVRKSDGQTDVLHTFNAVSTVSGSVGAGVNGDGAFPTSALTLNSTGDTLYGVTSGGGTNLRITSTGTVGTGTIYSVTTSGAFTTLYNFSAMDDTATTSPTVNVDGVQPAGSLLELPSGILVGTTSSGGNPALNDVPPATTSIGYGTIFRFDPGTGTLTTLYNFDNDHGAAPLGNLILSPDDNLIYGLTSVGSGTTTPVTQYGSFFSIDPDTTVEALSYNRPLTFAEGSGFTGYLTLGSDGDLYTTVQAGSDCTVLNGSGYGGVLRYSIKTGASSTGYSNCTQPSSGGGSMSMGFLCLLGMLGFAPPVRRRLFGFQ